MTRTSRCSGLVVMSPWCGPGTGVRGRADHTVAARAWCEVHLLSGVAVAPGTAGTAGGFARGRVRWERAREGTTPHEHTAPLGCRRADGLGRPDGRTGPRPPQPAAEAQGVTAMSAAHEAAALRAGQPQAPRPLGGCARCGCPRASTAMPSRAHGGWRSTTSWSTTAGCAGPSAPVAVSTVGEVIARGRSFAQASIVVRAWMRSPRHHDVLLLPRFRSAGVGAWRDPDGTVYVSVVFRAP